MHVVLLNHRCDENERLQSKTFVLGPNQLVKTFGGSPGITPVAGNKLIISLMHFCYSFLVVGRTRCSGSSPHALMHAMYSLGVFPLFYKKVGTCY